MSSMKDIVKAMGDSDLKDKVKVMIGGKFSSDREL